MYGVHFLEREKIASTTQKKAGKKGTKKSQSVRKKVPSRSKKLTEENLFVFLDALRCGLPLDQCAAAAKRPLTTFWKRRNRDAGFRNRWNDARAKGDVRWDAFWREMERGCHTIRSAAIKVGLDPDYPSKRAGKDPKFATRVMHARVDGFGSDAELLMRSARKCAEEGNPRPLAEAMRMMYPDILAAGARK